jgi:hypothetical protein
MPIQSPELDAQEPLGIIIHTGSARPSRMPFRAYFWSEEDGGACAPASEGPILESPSTADGLTPTWRASP